MIAWLSVAWAATTTGAISVPGDYPELVDAIAAAGPGETILLGPGIWTGPFLISSDVVIRATDGPATTVLQGLSQVQASVVVSTAALVLDGLTLGCGQKPALSVVDGAATLTNARFSGCAGTPVIQVTDSGASATLVVRDSVFDSLPTADPAILSTGGSLELDGVVFSDDGPSSHPVIDSTSSEWTFKDVDVVGVDRAAPLFRGTSLAAVEMTRVSVRCSAAGSSAIAIDAVGGVVVGPVLLYGVDTDVGGSLLDVSSLAPWLVEHATLVGEPTQVLLTARGGSGAVDASALAGGAAGVNGVQGAAVSGRYNLFEPGIVVATGDVLESAVTGMGSLVADPEFENWDAAVVCDEAVLAPQLGSPLVDAADPADSDRDGTRADIGATGGPEGFVLIGDDRDLDGVPDADDCAPLDPSIHPGAADPPYDGVDQDCDGVDLTDVDGDGFDAEVAGGRDCDDANPQINPDAAEVLDSVDWNCDGFVDPIRPIRPVGCDSSARAAGLWSMLGMLLLLLRLEREGT